MMLNFSKIVVRRVQITEKVAIVWSRTTPQYNQSILIKRCTYHTSQEKKSFCCSEFVCRVRQVAGLFSPWYVLQKLGVPCRSIINFRRALKRFAFPWLAYSLPIALAMGLGDILAQMFYNCRDDGKCEKKRVTDIDLKRTAIFMLIGFIVLGPLMSRLNRLLVRRLSFYPCHHYFIKRTVFNILLFTPIALLLGMLIYDYKQVQDCFPDIKTLWNKRYKSPFWEIMMFNVMTRPLIEMLIWLLPYCVKPFVRIPYEILFFSFISSVIHKYKFGAVSKICKPPPPPKKVSRFCKLRRSCNK